MQNIVPTARSRRLRDARLCDAASIGDRKRLKSLLAEGVSPDSSDEDSMTALMAASFAGQVEAVRILLAAGADPDAQDVSGMTALMNAVIANGEMELGEAHPIFSEIIALLLEAGADRELEDEDGSTAADYARTSDLHELVDLLEGR